MYMIEKTIVTAIFRVLLIMNSILTIINSVLLVRQNWNLPPSYFSDLLLLCHMLSTGIKLPGAVIYFNQRVIEAVTLKLDQVFLNSDDLKLRQLDSNKNGLRTAGYQFISATRNMGFTLWTFFYLTKIVFIFSNIILFFVKRKTRCGQLRLSRHCIRIM